MILYPMNKLLSTVSSRYELVNLVAKRARELSAESEAHDEPLEEKPVTIALNEACEGKIHAPEDTAEQE